MQADIVTNRYEEVRKSLQNAPGAWLITGVAGFIGSNLLEALLNLDQRVLGLDNFSTGRRENLEEVQRKTSPDRWRNFKFIEDDIRNLDACRKACEKVDYVLHQAALGSVPRSIDNPILSHDNNVNGIINMLVAARDCGVGRFVFASSSSVYGDYAGLPKVEEKTGRPLSPYAATKCVKELYAQVFSRTYGIETIGLRYFNVFGPRQNPEGAYAAVIPRWFQGLIRGSETFIFGDGETSRDFCFVANAVQANLLAAVAARKEALNRVYNVAYGRNTTLNRLFELIRERVAERHPEAEGILPTYKDFRAGDVRHSLADISAARELLGYVPRYSLEDGLQEAAAWYLENCAQAGMR